MPGKTSCQGKYTAGWFSFAQWCKGCGAGWFRSSGKVLHNVCVYEDSFSSLLSKREKPNPSSPKLTCLCPHSGGRENELYWAIQNGKGKTAEGN